MLYQLSYASPAQTQQKYHRGNRIASNYRAPANSLPALHLFPLPYLFVNLARRGLREYHIVDRFVVPHFGELNCECRARALLMNGKRQFDPVDLTKITEIFGKGARAFRRVM